MWKYLPEIVALPLMPLLRWQGNRVKTTAIRLPEAPGERTGLALPDIQSGQGVPLRVVGIGESPMAGVGVATQEESVLPQFAQALAQQLARPVHWQTYAKNGATLSYGLAKICPGIAPGQADIVVIGFGVNDTTAFKRPDVYMARMTAMIEMCREKLQPRYIVLVGVPPMQRFPVLPWPLKTVLGLKARVLDEVNAALASRHPDVLHFAVELDLNAADLMAMDGYHPSEAGARVWGNIMAEQISRILGKA